LTLPVSKSAGARRAKKNRLDSDKLLSLLMRYHAGERRLWAVARSGVGIGSSGACARSAPLTATRIRSLLMLHNLRVDRIGGRAWVHWWAQHATPLLPGLRAEIEREFERLSLVVRQIRTLEAL
jgi:transposase